MKQFKWLIFSLALWAAMPLDLANANIEPPYADSTLTRIGDISPVLFIHTVDNQVVDFHGKVVVLSFFATWCGPCMAEMTHLEKTLWQPLEGEGLVLIAIGREHSQSEVKAFQKAKDYTFQFAADPQRLVYGKFATQLIPRCVLIGKDGHIKYQSIGFSEENVALLVKAVKQELGK